MRAVDVVGCSHPGIDKIIESASSINPRVHLIVGGFHLVVASDADIEKTATALHDRPRVDVQRADFLPLLESKASGLTLMLVPDDPAHQWHDVR